MRSLTMIFAILCASVALGSNRQWQDAKVIKITSESAASLPPPMGTRNVGVPTTKTYYLDRNRRHGVRPWTNHHEGVAERDAAWYDKNRHRGQERAYSGRCGKRQEVAHC